VAGSVEHSNETSGFTEGRDLFSGFQVILEGLCSVIFMVGLSKTFHLDTVDFNGIRDF
jgi:hypothetical protein